MFPELDMRFSIGTPSSDGAAETAPDHDRLVVIVAEPRGAHQAGF
jgi:hypothetical protein